VVGRVTTDRCREEKSSISVPRLRSFHWSGGEFGGAGDFFARDARTAGGCQG